MGRVTLQTVADKVGVSRMTVSNAFSRPDQLSETLRTKILAAAEELGYAGPDPAARALARGTAGSVGVLMTDSLSYAFTDEVATGFLSAITEELAPTGRALTLLTSRSRGETVPARDVPMDGALVYSCDGFSAAVDWLVRRDVPLVFVDQTPVDDRPSVNVDDRAGARAAAQHLLDLGHRRVGILTGELSGPHGVGAAELPSDHHVSRQRILGWTDALRAAGVEPVVVREPLTPEDAAYEGARILLEREDRPTGILCFSDVMAHWVVRAAEDLGLTVPDDLSVVGFDDQPLARRMRPELTTVRQPIAEKGRAAAAALTAVIEAAQAGRTLPAEHVVLPTELVVRDSTGPAPTD
ncbi:MAG TPA: LacI family DNA-binding transcriptional regulator [Actinomycetes bacterium]|nr:LacI family DNA-binding transcriptional regulator [Actinomycetes bacterium]